MPSGRVHDGVTLLLAAPAFAAAYTYTRNPLTALIVTAGFLFGGLMFGPDLDTGSRQYSRWSFLRPIWLPYRALFRHRSRLTHGLLLGALLRVIYFHAFLAIIGFAGMWMFAAYAGKNAPNTSGLLTIWNGIANAAHANLGEYVLLLIFIGIWLGAASHTLTDVAGSYVKTGRPGRVV